MSSVVIQGSLTLDRLLRHFVMSETVENVDCEGCGRLQGVSGRLQGVSGKLQGVSGKLQGVSGKLQGVSGKLQGVSGSGDACPSNPTRKATFVKKLTVAKVRV